jgi:hypothetical protein
MAIESNPSHTPLQLSRLPELGSGSQYLHGMRPLYVHAAYTTAMLCNIESQSEFGWRGVFS